MDSLDDDILACIVRNNVGVFTYVQLSAVCKRLYRLCRSDESLLVSAALYTGGLTRTRFMGLFALTQREVGQFPYETVERAWLSGTYTMYRADAVHQAVRAVGGVAGWRSRVAARAPATMHHRSPVRYTARPFGKRRQWELEEDLHQAHPQAPTLAVGYTVPATSAAPHKRGACVH